MADLRIVDAPDLPLEELTEEVKIPTGGKGNYSVKAGDVATFVESSKDLANKTFVNNSSNGVKQQLEAHKNDETNPHNVTKGQVGLGSVDNTADLDKPVSNATYSAILTATADKADRSYVDLEVLKVEGLISASGEGYLFAKNEGDRLLLKPSKNSAVKVLDTHKVWLWETVNGGVTGTWTDTGVSELNLANQYTDSIGDVTLNRAINYADTNKIQKHVGFNREFVLYEVTDSVGNQTWLQVSGEDGKPTQFSKDAIRESVNIELGSLIFTDGEKTLYSLQDKNGQPTALSIRESDGMFSQFVIDNISERLDMKPFDFSELQYKPKPSDFQILSSISRGIARHVEARPLPSQITDAVNSTDQNIRLTFPNSYTDATPLILVICFEGIGDPSLDIRGAYADVLNHGVVWAKCSFHGNSYGNPAAMQDAKEVYQKVCEIAPIGGVIIAGNSMGGVAAFNTLTTEAVPNIIGLHLTDPVFSLRHRYDNGRAGDINAAYNCTVETYAEKTNGYDPDLQHWSKFKGVPIKVVATSNDTVVPMSFHTTKMVEKLNSHNDVQVIDTLAANHNSPEQFNVQELISFINKCASGAVITTI